MGLSCGYVLGDTAQPFAVSGNVVANCNTLSPQSSQTLQFNTPYDTTSASDNTTGPLTFSINCTKGDTNFTVSVGGGSSFTHASPSGSPNRAMTDGNNHFLTYQLYQSSGTLSPWAFNSGTGTGSAVNQNAGGLSSATTFSLYGIIPHGQTNAFVGSYHDTVLVTVNY